MATTNQQHRRRLKNALTNTAQQQQTRAQKIADWEAKKKKYPKRNHENIEDWELRLSRI